MTFEEIKKDENIRTMSKEEAISFGFSGSDEFEYYYITLTPEEKKELDIIERILKEGAENK